MSVGAAINSAPTAPGGRPTQPVALAMMIGGLATAIVWRQLGWHEQIYEGMPGILAGLGIYLLLARPVLAHA